MDLISAEWPELDGQPAPRAIRGVDAVGEGYQDFLADESRLAGDDVACVYFPVSTLEVCAALRECSQRGWRVLVSGARTGVVGGAVARGVDAIISLAHMDRVLRRLKTRIRVEAGVTLEMLEAAVADSAPDRFYPVDPTERSASVGGNIATNASGAHSYHYGPTRRWVQAITVALADGSLLQLRRGRIKADGPRLRFKLGDGTERLLTIPAFDHPRAKSTSGYPLRAGMDAIDLFIGAEGTLGVVTEAELRLTRRPAQRLYSVVWVRAEAQALALVERLRRARGMRPLAIEYFDPGSIELLKQRRRREGERSSVPHIDERASAALFLDLAFRDEAELERISAQLDRLLTAVGLSLDMTWSGLEERDLARMRQLRHALPETVNSLISERKRDNPSLHKLSTDLAVPEGALPTMLATYRDSLDHAGIEYVIFGHIGSDHLHLNMLPRDEAELVRAKQLYDELAAAAVGLGGTIAAEHGIGRLKRHLMPLQYPPAMLAAMRQLKEILDPRGTLNPGVLLPDGVAGANRVL